MQIRCGQICYINIQCNHKICALVIEISKDNAHRILGHAGGEATIAAAKALGWKLTGVNYVCSSCGIAKAKQKVMPNVLSH